MSFKTFEDPEDPSNAVNTVNTVNTVDIVHGSLLAHEQNGSDGEVRDEDEDWALNFRALMRYNKSKNWPEVLRVLVYLSNKEGHPEAYHAMGQAAWLALKIQTPITQRMIILYNILLSLGPTHRSAAPLASLANWLISQSESSKSSKISQEDRDLARAQAQQMLYYVTSEPPGKPFQQWVAENRLDDPDYFVPIVMETLEAMVEGAWWINREAIQKELLSHG